MSHVSVVICADLDAWCFDKLFEYALTLKSCKAAAQRNWSFVPWIGGDSEDYRTDIHDLRAIAVPPVVAFHYGMVGFARRELRRGDIFFVISCYLITRALLGSTEASKFSIAEFYHYRVRPMFPALFVMFGILSTDLYVV